MGLARFCLKHPVPVNLLMLLVFVLGLSSLFFLKREMFPNFSADIVEVVVVMDEGGTPDQVDRNINQIIQPRVQQVDGVKRVLSYATGSSGRVIVELYSGIDVDKVKLDIEDEINAIDDFPETALEPRVRAITIFDQAIQLAIYGDGATDLQLRKTLDFVKADLRSRGIVSKFELFAPRPLEIAIQLPLDTLRAKGISMQEVAEQIRQHSLEISAGEVRESSGNIIIKGQARKLSVDDLKRVPIRFPNGEAILLWQLAGPEGISDGFVEDDVQVTYNGNPAAVLSIEKADEEDIITLCRDVREYAETVQLPYGLKMVTFQDLSRFVKERLQLITKNGFYGFILVFVVLTLFLDWRVAFWATAGVVFCLIGTLAVLLYLDHSLNMLTLFAFLLATGMIVDDAIVVAESYFDKRAKGEDSFRAAKLALNEVSLPILAMMGTSIVAFVPLFFISGIMGKFMGVLPVVVVSALALSLFESLYILPSHLCHHCGDKNTRFMQGVGFILKPFLKVTRPVREFLSRFVEQQADQVLIPLVKTCIHFRYAVLVIFVSLLVFVIGLVPVGLVKTSLFPRVDADFHRVDVAFEEGTAIAKTRQSVDILIESLVKVAKEEEERSGVNPVADYFVEIGEKGAHKASVSVQLVSFSKGRAMSGQQFLDSWRALVPPFPNAVSLEYQSASAGPKARPIEVLLSSTDEAALIEVEQLALEYFAKVPGVVDLGSSYQFGPWTVSVKLKEEARELPISESELISNIAAIYRGVKVDTFYRDENEVNIYVRAQRDDRDQLQNLKQVLLPNGLRVGQVADIQLTREPAEILRVDGQQTIEIYSNLDFSSGVNAAEVRQALVESFLDPLADKYPEVRWSFSGESKDGMEAIDSMLQAYLPAMLAIYMILATIFSSYSWPLVIMVSIPFSIVGAILGHGITGYSINIMSGFGIVGLTGIAVNDSLVLLDCIHGCMPWAKSFEEALVTGCRRRFRPIMLTSLTTMAGMAPILLETSYQAQFLKPMVVSIVFGIALVTPLILLVVPSMAAILMDVKYLLGSPNGTELE